MIKQYLAEKRAVVEEALERLKPEASGELGEHIRSLNYSLEAGGKRVRPILCIAAAEAVDSAAAQSPLLLPVACSLECIHTYSLIHDDLPAMDDDELRRGKPTNHMVFGEAGAILAGDGLLTYAFELLSLPVADDTLPEGGRLRIIHTIARAAGSLGMVGGQALDIAAEEKKISIEQLRKIHSCKTGALITASVQAGAIIGGADTSEFEALSDYAAKIGLAFQIVDDLLNVTATTEQLGKAAGSDADRNKATYPAFFGVEKTRKMAKETVDQAVAALSPFDEKADPLRELAHYIYHRSH